MESSNDVHHLPSNFSITAPGKVILHGEHSVVYNRLAIAASLNLRTKVEYSQLDNSGANQTFVRFILPNIGVDIDLPSSFVDSLLSLPTEESWSFNDPQNVPFESLLEKLQMFLTSQQFFLNLKTEQQQPALKSCLFLMAAILNSSKNNSSNLKPFELRFSSELPVGAGAGSSASYNVCLAAVFVCLANFMANPKSSFCLDENTKALISRWAFLGESIIHGNASGLDNSICTFGSLMAFRRPNTLRKIPLHSGVQVLLVNTNVSRKTKTLVEKVAKLKEHHGGSVTAIMEALDCISSEAEELYTHLDDAKKIHNQERVEELFSRMEELWCMNHSLLQALGVSHPSLERIIEVSKKYKLCGKLTGAGGGGFAIVLVTKSTGHEALKEELKSCGFDVKDVELGGPGVQMHIVS